MRTVLFCLVYIEIFCKMKFFVTKRMKLKMVGLNEFFQSHASLVQEQKTCNGTGCDLDNCNATLSAVLLQGLLMIGRKCGD